MPWSSQYALLTEAVTIESTGRVSPTSEQRGDVAFGWPLLVELASLNAATALAVRERDVIAVRCAEGLDAMIERSGQLCRKHGWTLILCDDDTPDGTGPGPEMIGWLRQASAGCLALGGGLEATPELLAAADPARIAVVRVGRLQV
jgi:hypothetical protein